MIKAVIPNLLTLSRIVGVGFGIVLLFSEKPYSDVTAFCLFVLIASTDALDGYLARKWDVVSGFGKIMDPIADKVFILALFVSFSILGLISFLWTGIIAIREVAVTVSRLQLVMEGRVIAAEKSGKMKTIFQNITLFFVFMLYFFVQYVSPEKGLLVLCFEIGVLVLCAYTTFLTIVSGIEYYQNIKRTE